MVGGRTRGETARRRRRDETRATRLGANGVAEGGGRLIRTGVRQSPSFLPCLPACLSQAHTLAVIGYTGSESRNILNDITICTVVLPLISFLHASFNHARPSFVVILTYSLSHSTWMMPFSPSDPTDPSSLPSFLSSFLPPWSYQEIDYPLRRAFSLS